MTQRTILATLVGLVLAAPAASADTEPLLGTWLTEPDRKGGTGHVAFETCDAAVCGTVVAAFDAEGQPTTTENVGRQIIWDMVHEGAGAYGGGRVYVPLMKKDFPVTIQVEGDSLSMRACNTIGICRTQTWQRVP